MSVLDKFFQMNRTLCKKVEPYLPQAKTRLDPVYEVEVARYMNLRPEQVVVDVGGGKSCPFAKYRDPAMRTKIIAVDISEAEINENSDVDEKRVANITQSLPFGPEEVDIIASSWVLEHLEYLESFISNSKRTLKKDGYFIHLFPSKFALFALINQALPKKLSRRLSNSHLTTVAGFPAFYDNCYYSAIKALLEKHDFKVMKTQLGYYQAPYFGFFFPLFMVSAFYEVLLYALGAKDLCVEVLVVARKR